MKRFLCLILVLALMVSFVAITANAIEPKPSPNPEAYPDFADKNYGALYAHAELGGNSSQAWQRWHKDVEGINFKDGVRYFFLPKTASDTTVEIYNNYPDSDIVIGDVIIEPYTSDFINYKEGEEIKALRFAGKSNEKEYTIIIYKSDAEASVYVNDSTNSYVDYKGTTQNTDLWSFLIQNKENSVSGSACTIVDENGVNDTTLKKIKGRGNTNWKETDKKPFNLTFNEKTTIGDTTDKKFSFVSNAKDSTLLRNSVMYDLADAVGSPYSPEQSFVDFYVNGVYRGSYIACQKIDMGKNSVVSLKDTSDEESENFNFLVEVDVWNYKSDVYFVSDKGYHVVLKTPDLDDYDETDPFMKAQYEYIKSTYQKLEDALYKGTLADIEKICDIESLATQYLLQELGKNCDGGYTSTFFTYNAEEQKFYAAPIWDCDSCLGAVDCVREGCTTSTNDHTGWTTRTAIYEDTVNPLGQAFYVKGTTSDGLTFEELCKKLWNENFIPAIDVLLGNKPSEDKLKSIDEYADMIDKSAYINYVMWDFMWLCGDRNSSLNIKYTKDYDGELEYLKDWTRERTNWLSKMFSGEADDDISERVVYFSTELEWNDVHCYYWGDGYVPVKWPGISADIIATNDENGLEVYKATIPTDVTKIIFNNGADGEQTVNITLNKENNYYITSDSTGRKNEAKCYIYNIVSSLYVENQPETKPTVPMNSTEPTEVTPTTSVNTPPETTGKQDESESTTSTSSAQEANTSTSIPTSTTFVPSSEITPTTNTTGPDTSLLGDVNSDNKVNIKDATALQKHLAKLLTLSDKSLKVADTNKDGRVTISDATAIQKKIAGLISWD